MIWCLGLALKYGILSGKANDAVCRRPHPQTHQKRETRLRSLRCRHSLKVRTSRPKLTSTFIFPTHTTQLGSRQRKEEERADFFDEGGFCSQSVPAVDYRLNADLARLQRFCGFFPLSCWARTVLQDTTKCHNTVSRLL